MKTQLKNVASLIAWSCCFAPALSRSVDAAEHEALLPYLTDDVAAVAYLDVSSMDLPAIVAEVRGFGVPDELIDQAATGVAEAQKIYDQLSDLGARRAYVLVRTSDLADQGFSWVVEVADEGQADAIAGMLAGIFGANSDSGNRSGVWFAPRRIKTHAGVVLAAMNDDQMERLRDRTTSAPSAEALEALAALGDADEGIVVFGDPDSRRVIREMFPQLPAPFMEIDGRLIADGLKWGGVKIKHPPQPLATVVIEATSDEVAETVQQSIAKGLELAKALALASLAGGGADFPVEPVRIAQGLALLNPDLEGQRLTLTLGDDDEELAFVRDLLAPAVGAARESATRQQRMNQFKQIALAMHNYASAHSTNTKAEGRRSSFPSHANYDKSDRPLLSWRVHVLPFVDQGALYQQFHLDEPWDSEHNLQLINQMPEAFADPDPVIRTAVGEGRTTYVVPFGEETVFYGKDGTSLRDVTDGTSQTILCVEVIPERAVVWTKPGDWELNLDQPLNGVRRTDRNSFTAARCDGSVHNIANDVDSDAFRAMLTKAGED